MTFESALKMKLIYVFRINDEAHRGCLKIGEATCKDDTTLDLKPCCHTLNQAAKERINQYTQTAGIAYDLLYTEATLCLRQGTLCTFNDKEVHRVLLRSGIKRKLFDKANQANEWFCCDLETVKRAITAVKQGRTSLLSAEMKNVREPIVFRPEQADAIAKTKKQFKRGNQMLWNAKMRFGKTLSALQVAKDMNFRRTLILTHRPVVDEGWFEDFGKIFYDREDYEYGSKNKGQSLKALAHHAGLSFTINGKTEKGKYVYFASMQDLRGSELVGGKFDKNDEVFSTPWDMLIVDEAHEGTKTDLGQAVLKELIKPATKVLRLSGTPFNLLDDFKDEEIYTWDYVMEQRAKAEWNLLHQGDPNPYESLPKLNIYTYELGRLLHDYADEDIAFNFHEFFRVNPDGAFAHLEDVKRFLNLLCSQDKDSLYPYSNKKFQDIFRHTLWMVPGVKAASALSELLRNHPVFGAFHIVNVAGDGDEEENSKDALQDVLEAIGDDSDLTCTITLSCGRLTTGVSVKAWTAVFMLSGSYKTQASTYMQTIFRVQTPYTHKGKMKTQCYVFDFAPDRTLQVLAETAKVSAKAGKQSDEDRKIMGDFLNFCPVIAIEGSKMSRYDVNKMMKQLKKVYVEQVVQNGFEDTHLYNDQLLKLTDVELQEFDGLKKIIGKTKAMAKTKDIDINKQGLTEEQYEESEKLEKKKRSKEGLTDEEKARLAELKKKKENRESAVSILRGISIRMPLMLYGARIKNEDEEITIDNFTALVDPQSWEEFMPKGVSKQLFNSFKKYYDEDIFSAAGKRIRAMARAADSLSVEERIERITSIFSTFRNPDKETVLTPWRVVNMHMGDCLGGYNFMSPDWEEPLGQPRHIDQGEVTSRVFRPDAHILEINSKSGLYPLYMAYNIYRVRKVDEEAMFGEPLNRQLEQDLWEKVLRENIFVICKTPMAKEITRRTLCGFRETKMNTRYFEDLINQITNKSQQFVERVSNGKGYWKANELTNMRFDAIVGNPPYQVMDGGAGVSAKPVYNAFVDIAKKLRPTYISLIMPARWYAGGKGLDDFRDEMLHDKSICKLFDYFDATYVFPRIDLSGGICYFLRDNNYHNGVCKVTAMRNGHVSVKSRRLLDDSGLFIRFNEAVSILEKVRRIYNKSTFFDSLVSSRKPFGVQTNDKVLKQEGTDTLFIYAYPQNGYYENPKIKTGREYIKKYKVFISYAYGERGDFPYFVIGKPFIGKPQSICSETYLVISPNESEKYVNNVAKYLRCKFTRALILLKKNTQHATSKVYTLVPLQDFTSHSDIDWSQPVEDIDRQLYRKYGLTEDEVAFIEKTIKPM